MSPGRHAYPRGIEILLKKAKADEEFRGRFLDVPCAAAHSIQLELTSAEETVLSHTPRETLRTMVEQTSLPRRFVPAFRRARAAATLIALTACSVVVSEGSPTSEGILSEPFPHALPVDTVLDQLTVVREVLELYRSDHGTFPTTRDWSELDNPLDGYLERTMLFDPWHNRLVYEGREEDGVVVSYRLASTGVDADLPDDDLDSARAGALSDDPAVGDIHIEEPADGQEIELEYNDYGRVKPIPVRAVTASPQPIVTWLIDGQDLSIFRASDDGYTHFERLRVNSGEHRLTVVGEDGLGHSITFTVVEPALEDKE